MGNKPKITVGIPTYNRSHYLSLAIESVIAQSFEEFELLIVDNASTDDTSAVAMRYLEKDSRIRYFRNETNLGMTGNWLRISELASTDYIKFLMDDDLLKPGCLKAFSDAADKYPSCALIACLADFSHEQGDLLDVNRHYYAPERVIPGRLMLRFLLDWSNQIGCPTNVMFKAEHLKRHGRSLWYQTNNTWSPDYDMMIRVLSEGDFYCLNSFLVTIRIHELSETSQLNVLKMQKAEWDSMLYLISILGENDEDRGTIEMHSARTAFIRGIEAVYLGKFDHAGYFLNHWLRSPKRRLALFRALSQSNGRVLLPMKALKRWGIVKSMINKVNSINNTFDYRQSQMAEFWKTKPL
ncbi:GalNAc(5)-diNAcBac-PP-undecaprenol beta-1,3-glucosyltransferase [compost metagenome]